VWLYQLEKVLFFFHPVLWLAGREIKKERESACDDLVLSRSAITAGTTRRIHLGAEAGKPRAAVSTAVAMAEPFEVEKRRLMMILREASPRLSAGWIAALVVVVAAGLPTFGNGVASTRPTVEMISSALRQQVEACGDSLQIRYSVSVHPVDPPSVHPSGEIRYVRTPRAILMEVVRFDQRGDKNDHVTRFCRDRVTKEEKNITVQVPDEIVLSGEIGAGAAQTTITSLTTMETALLCLLDPDALLYECVRYGTIAGAPTSDN